MKTNYFLAIFSLGLLLIFSSCGKDKLDLLRGTWERVNVADLDDPYIYEWTFGEGDLSISRRSSSNSGLSAYVDSGIYVLETTPFNTRLNIVDTSQELWNNTWDVLNLDEEQLIIRMDIEGGVLYFEFVKIN